MGQDALFYENLNDAIKATCMACGGLKVVANLLYPEKKLESAHRYLSDALNEDRAEKLSPDQVLFIMKLGRQKDCHILMDYYAKEADYEYKPIDKETAQAKLQREFIDAQRQMALLAKRMEKVGIL